MNHDPSLPSSRRTHHRYLAGLLSLAMVFLVLQPIRSCNLYNDGICDPTIEDYRQSKDCYCGDNVCDSQEAFDESCPEDCGKTEAPLQTAGTAPPVASTTSPPITTEPPDWVGFEKEVERAEEEWLDRIARDGVGDVMNYEMTALAEAFDPFDDIVGAVLLWEGYPLDGWNLPESYLAWNDEGHFPIVMPTGTYDTMHNQPPPGSNALLGGDVQQGDIGVGWNYPANDHVNADIPPILPFPGLANPAGDTSALPHVRRGGGLLAIVPQPVNQMGEAAWFGYQVFWPWEWEAAPIAFTTPNATVTLEGAWAGVLYDASGGETAFWLEQGQATVQGNADEQPLAVQGPADGEHVALVMVSSEGKAGAPKQVGAEVLAERFGVADALSSMFTVVITVAGPPDPLPEDLNDLDFVADHPWGLLVDADGDPNTGFSIDFAHMRGLGTEFEAYLVEGGKACSLSGGCDASLLEARVLSPTQMAFSFPVTTLREALGETLDPQKMVWRVVHVNYTIPEPDSPKDTFPDPP
ncbi:MAG: hypothetical protein D6770_09425 [Anaerolineae bacterium]|nr:MAG: hypothetical protein D6770_09425 [Anaerolineae bacterium]